MYRRVCIIQRNAVFRKDVYYGEKEAVAEVCVRPARSIGRFAFGEL